MVGWMDDLLKVFLEIFVFHKQKLSSNPLDYSHLNNCANLNTEEFFFNLEHSFVLPQIQNI